MKTSIAWQETEESRSLLVERLSRTIEALPLEERSKKKAGRPQQVEWKQIVLGVLVSVLFGMNNYQQLWRRLRSQPLGSYEPIEVKDDAIIKRLRQAGTRPWEDLFEQLQDPEEDLGQAEELAPFARSVVALDEMAGEQMQRHLKTQWGLPAGDKRLLPGKLSGRFNVRSQQWERVQWQPDAQANCKVNVGTLLLGLAVGSLLLFDLGYFAFAWFDQLSSAGYWWISRLREKTSYQLVHTFWRLEGNLDALIWLGAYRSDRAGRMVRLVRFWDGEKVHSYITNVLDPRQLSLKHLAQLYARRWDIELAFLLLKEYLPLRQWWSSQAVLVQQQCLAVLIVAQEVHRLQVRLARQAGVPIFDVSLPLVMEQVPHWLDQGQDPQEWMSRYGKALGLIRPSSRLVPVVPEVKEEELRLPQGPLPENRKERYHRYEQRGEGEEADATISKTGTAKKREKRKREKKEREEKMVNVQEKRENHSSHHKKRKKQNPLGIEKERISLFSG